MEHLTAVEQARQALRPCREAAARARTVLERAREGLARTRADTEERVVRGEAARTAAEVDRRRAGDLRVPDASRRSAGRGVS